MGKQSWWLCYECDHVIKAVEPPAICPKCKKSDQIGDITRNVPETAPSYSKIRVDNRLLSYPDR